MMAPPGYPKTRSTPSARRQRSRMSAPLSIHDLLGRLRRRFRLLLFARNPRHHSAQPFAHRFDRMVFLGLPERRELFAATLVLGNPFLRERPVLNPRQYFLHLLARPVAHHSIAA